MLVAMYVLLTLGVLEAWDDVTDPEWDDNEEDEDDDGVAAAAVDELLFELLFALLVFPLLLVICPWTWML